MELQLYLQLVGALNPCREKYINICCSVWCFLDVFVLVWPDHNPFIYDQSFPVIAIQIHDLLLCLCLFNDFINSPQRWTWPKTSMRFQILEYTVYPPKLEKIHYGCWGTSRKTRTSGSRLNKWQQGWLLVDDSDDFIWSYLPQKLKIGHNTKWKYCPNYQFSGAMFLCGSVVSWSLFDYKGVPYQF